MLLKFSFVFVSAVILAAGPQASKELSPTPQVQPDVTFEVSLDSSAKARDEMRAKTRAWLWSHWQDHKPGRMDMVTYTLEGEKITTTFSLEQSPSGVWHIISRSERLLRDSRYPGQVFPQSSETDAHQLDRVRVRTQGARKEPGPVPPAEHLDAENYRLVFRDQRGKTLFEL